MLSLYIYKYFFLFFFFFSSDIEKRKECNSQSNLISNVLLLMYFSFPTDPIMSYRKSYPEDPVFRFYI